MIRVPPQYSVSRRFWRRHRRLILVVVPVAVLIVALLASHVLNDPLRTLPKGASATVLARGLDFNQAEYLPSGEVLAAGTQQLSRAYYDSGSRVPGREADHLLLLGPRGRTEIAFALGEGYRCHDLSFCVDPSGKRAMVGLDAWHIPLPGTAEEEHSVSHGEIFLVDLTTRKATRIATLAEGRRCSLVAWLPHRDAALLTEFTPDSDAESLVVVDTHGKLRTLAKVPPFVNFHVSADGRSIVLVSLTSEAAPASQHVRLVTVDLATGETSRRRVVESPMPHPGPLTSHETPTSLVSFPAPPQMPVVRLAAIDRRAARLRFLTWPLSGVGDFRLAPNSKWAFVSVFDVHNPTRLETRLLAVPLADGMPRQLMVGDDAEALDVGSGGRLLAMVARPRLGNVGDPMGELVEIRVNYDKLARAPMFRDKGEEVSAFALPSQPATKPKPKPKKPAAKSKSNKAKTDDAADDEPGST